MPVVDTHNLVNVAHVIPRADLVSETILSSFMILKHSGSENTTQFKERNGFPITLTVLKCQLLINSETVAS